MIALPDFCRNIASMNSLFLRQHCFTNLALEVAALISIDALSVQNIVLQQPLVLQAEQNTCYSVPGVTACRMAISVTGISSYRKSRKSRKCLKNPEKPEMVKLPKRRQTESGLTHVNGRTGETEFYHRR